MLREGKSVNLSVTLGRREEAESAPVATAAPPTPEPAQTEVLGMTLMPLTDELAQGLGLAAGSTGLVVSAVDPASEAYAKGMRDGDVITEAGQQKLTALKDMDVRIAEAKDAGRKSLLLLIRRGGDPRFVALSLE